MDARQAEDMIYRWRSKLVIGHQAERDGDVKLYTAAAGLC